MIQTRPVILCGGSGTRLWPLSRSGFPKQFLCLTGNESLFQQATRRLVGLAGEDIDVSAPSIVTNEEHRFLALEQMREIGVNTASVLLEPVGRNTAPALTLAALAAREDEQDPILLVTPADQAVADTAAFTAAMHTATRQAAEGAIVILGVPPTAPETGYGYIKVAAAAQPGPIFSVEHFVEKPDAATAARFLAEGGYYWNAGIFVLKASVWLEALAQFRPDILHATREAWDWRSIDAAFIRPDKAEFGAVPAESIDYAVMEPLSTQHLIKMVPLDAGWSDLGAWDAVCP
jgi:mannose-1-phosphate guanylyltransferase/mannose-6-phosphate isomerase